MFYLIVRNVSPGMEVSEPIRKQLPDIRRSSGLSSVWYMRIENISPKQLPENMVFKRFRNRSQIMDIGLVSNFTSGINVRHWRLAGLQPSV